MVEIRTAKNGTRFLFDHDGKNALVFIGERLHMTIVDVPQTDEAFQKEIDSFMDSWNEANPRVMDPLEQANDANRRVYPGSRSRIR